MSEKYVCMKCKSAGAKSLIPYKIIEDRNGESINFKGQLCEKCFNELFGRPRNTEDNNEENK